MVPLVGISVGAGVEGVVDDADEEEKKKEKMWKRT